MNKLKGKTVLVTGGAGFIGSHIVDALVKEKANILVYDNFVRGNKKNLVWAKKNGNVKIIKGDIRDARKLASAFKGVDYCFHEAALWLLECENNPRKAIDINIIGTYNVCEACVKAGVKKLVAASSSSVYGNGIYFPTDEKHPFNNYLFYGMTKIADEQIFKCFYKNHNLNYIAFRYLNVYGPRQDYKSAYISVIMNFINRIAKYRPPTMYGDGSATLDLIYVEDIAAMNIAAMKSNITNEVFNGASGKETTLKKLADTIQNIMGTTLQYEYKKRNSKLVTRRFGCPEKTKVLLKFTPKFSVQQGLRKVIKWIEEDLSNKK